MQKILLWTFWAVIGAALAFLASFDWRGTETQPFYSKMALLDEALQKIETNYVNPADEKKLFYGSIRGIVHALDPYCDFIEPEKSQDYLNDLHGNFEGLGLYLTTESGRLVVVAPLEGTPAYKAGIMPGDRIIKIDGVPTDGISLNEASRRLRGEKGTTVRLEVIHSGETEPVEIIIKRDVIQIKSVRGVRMLDPIYAIGYLQITRFQENTPQEFKKSVDRLRSVGLNGLIIDLRNNPGGALESAVSIAEMFLNNRTIVRIKERNKPMQEIKSGSNAVFSNIPVAVLTNRGTASAAEVLAGALQDNEVAILVGERTFGKGSVQSLYALSSEPSILKLTTALYFTPNYHSVHKGVPCLHNGICYHRQTDLDAASGGLRPNLEVPLSQNEQLLLRKLQQQSEFEGEKYDPTVALAVDRQLRSALDVLRNRSLFKKTLSYTTEEF